MLIFIKLVYLSSVISLKWQWRLPMNEITELKYTSLIKMIILEENFKWHLEAFASELFIYSFTFIIDLNYCAKISFYFILSFFSFPAFFFHLHYPSIHHCLIILFFPDTPAFHFLSLPQSLHSSGRGPSLSCHLSLSLSLSLWERLVDERVSGGHSTPLRLAPAKALLCAECRSLPAVTQTWIKFSFASKRGLSLLNSLLRYKPKGMYLVNLCCWHLMKKKINKEQWAKSKSGCCGAQGLERGCAFGQTWITIATGGVQR